MKKGGHGKGNWGDEKKPLLEGEEPTADATAPAEETKERPQRERRERREEVVEKVESEEEEGFTLQDYLNQKAAKNVKLSAENTREHEKLNVK